MNPIVKFVKLDPAAVIPQYQTEGAAGLDLVSTLHAVIGPGCTLSVPTGLGIEIPQGFEGQVRPRSGLAAKYGLTVLNAPGTIDSDYRGEVRVLLVNHSRHAFEMYPGDRIAQLVIAPVARALVEEVAGLSDTARGAGGFGSTGR